MLKLNSWDSWFGFATNLSVFLGLVLVAYEIGQTRVQLEISASSDGTDNFVQAMEILVQDEELSQLVYTAENSYHELDDFQKWRLFKYLDGYMTMSEQDFGVYSSLGDEEIATTFGVDWRENMGRPMYREYWKHRKQRYNKSFREFIDRILISDGTNSV
jgi:hypothetical protein